MPRENHSPQIAVRVPAKLKRDLETYAEQHGMSFSGYVRMVLFQEVKRQQLMDPDVAAKIQELLSIARRQADEV